jgi:O-antigen/teichoic acid export membrane protein
LADGALTTMSADHHTTYAPARRIARNAAVRAGGEAIGKLASIAFFVAMARELGQDGFGDFMFALSLSTVLVLASGFGTEELVAREVARDHSRVHHYLANVAAVKAAISVILLILAAVIVNLGDWPADARAAVYIVGLGVALENLGRTWHSVFTAYERLAMISISLVIQRTLTAGVGIGVLLAGGGVVAVSVVFAAGALIGLLVATQVLRRFVVAPRWEIDRSRWVPLVKAGVPIGLAALLFTILLRLDAALLGLLTGGDDNSEVGVYAAAFRLVEGTLFVSWAFTASVLPWLARQTADASVARGYELGIKAITSVLMPIGLAFVLLASPLIDLLYGPDYDDAVLPLQLLAVMTVLYGLNSLASTVLITRDRPQHFTWIVAFVAFENIVLNLILIPKYGADGTAFNAALSGLLLAVLSIALVSRHFGRIRLLRAFGAPVAGGLAMAAVMLPTDLPLVPAAAVGVACYLAGLLTFEALVFPSDLARIRAAVWR